MRVKELSTIKWREREWSRHMKEQPDVFKVKDVLPSHTHFTGAFILDTGKVDEDGKEKYADRMQEYHWNMHRFNKLKAGALVLYRTPAKMAKDRKFAIYGGGYVECVSAPDPDGNVFAKITHYFNLMPALIQGTEPLESFHWSHRERNGDSWMHFFAQYGMNEITQEDFWKLVGTQDCTPLDTEHMPQKQKQTSTLERFFKEACKNGSFTIFVDDASKYHMKERYHIDTSSLPQPQGQDSVRWYRFAERIVQHILEEQKTEQGWKTIQEAHHQNLPFDFCCIPVEPNRTETYVDVKVSSEASQTAFRFSRMQYEYQKTMRAQLYIYVLHDFDAAQTSCRLKIYHGPFDERRYRLEPAFYNVYPKE